MEEVNSDVSTNQTLKETAELSDITREAPPERAPQDSELKIEIADQGTKREGSASIETVYENAVIDKTVSSVTASRITAAADPVSAAPLTSRNTAPGSTPSQLHNAQQQDDRGSLRYGRMNKLRDHASTVFPAGIMGCKENNDELPSPRRLMDAHEASHDSIGHIENTPRKAGLRNDRGRNPVLGTGLESSDCMDWQKRGEKEKDDTKLDKKVTPSTRVPPGGFSQGLW